MLKYIFETDVVTERGGKMKKNIYADCLFSSDVLLFY